MKGYIIGVTLTIAAGIAFVVGLWFYVIGQVS